MNETDALNLDTGNLKNIG